MSDSGGAGGSGASNAGNGSGGTPVAGEISPGWLLYEARDHQGAVTRVFATDLSEGSETPLSLVDAEGTAPAFAPLWSPNGRYVALLVGNDDSPGDLHVVDFSGDAPGQARKIASNATSVTWSPDGTRILYVDPGEKGLWIADASATSSAPVLLAARCPIAGIEYACVVNDSPVAWSPDGQWLAFKGTPRNTVGSSELFVVSSSGEGAPTLVSPVQHDVGSTGVNEIVWSPDSSKLAFSANIEHRLKVEAYVVDWIGATKANRVKLHTAGRVQTGGQLLWSSDGSGVLVAGSFRDEDRDEIFAVPVSSGPTVGSLVDLSGLSGDGAILQAFRRDWLSPSGSYLAFIARVDELYVLDWTQGLGMAPPTPIRVDLLLSPGEELRAIAWTPTAERFLVSSIATDGEIALHLVEVSKTADPVRLELSLAHPSTNAFQWAPDSAHLAYVAKNTISDEVDLFVLSLPPEGTPGTPQLVNRLQSEKVTGFGGMGGDLNGSHRDGNVKVHCCGPSVLWNADASLLAFEAEAGTQGIFELFVAPFTGETAGVPFRVHSPLGAGGYIVDWSFRP